MDTSYFLLPFFTWCITGVVKFSINCVKEKRLAFELIGYGGMPSNHSAIVSSMASYVGLREGMGSPVFGVAVALSFIVVIDALSLRKTIERHAKIIRELSGENVRTRIGHSWQEVIMGILVGVGISILFYVVEYL